MERRISIIGANRVPESERLEVESLQRELTRAKSELREYKNLLNIKEVELDDLREEIDLKKEEFRGIVHGLVADNNTKSEELNELRAQLELKNNLKNQLPPEETKKLQDQIQELQENLNYARKKYRILHDELKLIKGKAVDYYENKKPIVVPILTDSLIMDPLYGDNQSSLDELSEIVTKKIREKNKKKIIKKTIIKRIIRIPIVKFPPSLPATTEPENEKNLRKKRSKKLRTKKEVEKSLESKAVDEKLPQPMQEAEENLPKPSSDTKVEITEIQNKSEIDKNKINLIVTLPVTYSVQSSSPLGGNKVFLTIEPQVSIDHLKQFIFHTKLPYLKANNYLFGISQNNLLDVEFIKFIDAHPSFSTLFQECKFIEVFLFDKTISRKLGDLKFAQTTHFESEEEEIFYKKLIRRATGSSADPIPSENHPSTNKNPSLLPKFASHDRSLPVNRKIFNKISLINEQPQPSSQPSPDLSIPLDAPAFSDPSSSPPSPSLPLITPPTESAQPAFKEPSNQSRRQSHHRSHSVASSVPSASPTTGDRPLPTMDELAFPHESASTPTSPRASSASVKNDLLTLQFSLSSPSEAENETVTMTPRRRRELSQMKSPTRGLSPTSQRRGAPPKAMLTSNPSTLMKYPDVHSYEQAKQLLETGEYEEFEEIEEIIEEEEEITEEEIPSPAESDNATKERDFSHRKSTIPPNASNPGTITIVAPKSTADPSIQAAGSISSPEMGTSPVNDDPTRNKSDPEFNKLAENQSKKNKKDEEEAEMKKIMKLKMLNSYPICIIGRNQIPIIYIIHNDTTLKECKKIIVHESEELIKRLTCDQQSIYIFNENYVNNLNEFQQAASKSTFVHQYQSPDAPVFSTIAKQVVNKILLVDNNRKLIDNIFINEYRMKKRIPILSVGEYTIMRDFPGPIKSILPSASSPSVFEASTQLPASSYPRDSLLSSKPNQIQLNADILEYIPITFCLDTGESILLHLSKKSSVDNAKRVALQKLFQQKPATQENSQPNQSSASSNLANPLKYALKVTGTSYFITEGEISLEDLSIIKFCKMKKLIPLFTLVSKEKSTEDKKITKKINLILNNNDNASNSRNLNWNLEDTDATDFRIKMSRFIGDKQSIYIPATDAELSPKTLDFTFPPEFMIRVYYSIDYATLHELYDCIYGPISPSPSPSPSPSSPPSSSLYSTSTPNPSYLDPSYSSVSALPSPSTSFVENPSISPPPGLVHASESSSTTQQTRLTNLQVPASLSLQPVSPRESLTQSANAIPFASSRYSSLDASELVQGSKNINVTSNSTTDDIVRAACSKINKNIPKINGHKFDLLRLEDHLLKISGWEVYLLQNRKLTELLYVRECVQSKQIISFNLVLKSKLPFYLPLCKQLKLIVHDPSSESVPPSSPLSLSPPSNNDTSNSCSNTTSSNVNNPTNSTASLLKDVLNKSQSTVNLCNPPDVAFTRSGSISIASSAFLSSRDSSSSPSTVLVPSPVPSRSVSPSRNPLPGSQPSAQSTTGGIIGGGGSTFNPNFNDNYLGRKLNLQPFDTVSVDRFGDEETVSLLELKSFFEVKVVSVKNLNHPKYQGDSDKFYVSIGIYYGGELLEEKMQTPSKPINYVTVSSNFNKDSLLPPQTDSSGSNPTNSRFNNPISSMNLNGPLKADQLNSQSSSSKSETGKDNKEASSSQTNKEREASMKESATSSNSNYSSGGGNKESVVMWNKWLRSGIRLCNIPEDSRLCITLYYYKNNNSLPIANVNYSLFDFKDHFRMGDVQLRMWMDEGQVANPIGTCMENIRSEYTKVPVIHLRFHSYPLNIGFPNIKLLELDNHRIHSPSFAETQQLKKIIDDDDPLKRNLSKTEKELLWKYREWLKDHENPKSLIKILQCINWCEVEKVQEVYRLLSIWNPVYPDDALQLLDAQFANRKVREFAVHCLDKLSDEHLKDYLLQLIQVLKYEPNHFSPLAIWLLDRSLHNQILIGHAFFWHLKSELHNPEISERFSLLLEMYLRACGSQRDDILNQLTVVQHLNNIALFVKTIPLSRRKAELQKRLALLNLPEKFQIPLDPLFVFPFFPLLLHLLSSPLSFLLSILPILLPLPSFLFPVSPLFIPSIPRSTILPSLDYFPFFLFPLPFANYFFFPFLLTTGCPFLLPSPFPFSLLLYPLPITLSFSLAFLLPSLPSSASVPLRKLPSLPFFLFFIKSFKKPLPLSFFIYYSIIFYALLPFLLFEANEIKTGG